MFRAGDTAVIIADDVLEFDCFRLDRRRRQLDAHGQELSLQGRAFDLLEFLVLNRDRVLGRNEIVAHVWHGLAMAENNLTVQMSVLRRVLDAHGGGGLVITVPGTGYRFVGDVQAPAPAPVPALARVAASPGNLPLPAFSRPGLGRAVMARRWLVMLLLPLLLVFTGWASLHSWRTWGPPRLSVAVLPFANLGPDRDQDYLADAVTDDLITDLSQLPGSTVIARDSAATIAQQNIQPPAIGRALNVRYLLEGSVHPEGNILHITARLVDAPSARHLWASSFDVARNGLDNARLTIVQRLSEALNFQLIRIEAARSLHERPDNPDAMDLYLRARWTLHADPSFTGLTAAQHLLERASAASPGFADADAELGIVMVAKMGRNDDPDLWRDHDEAAAAVARATAAVAQNPQAIEARGWLKWFDERCAEAIGDFQLALTLDPGTLGARDGLASCAKQLGQMPAMIAQLQDLLRIDPAGSYNGARENLIGFGYLMLGQPTEARRWLEQAASHHGNAGDGAMDWPEWNSLYLVAALAETGDRPAAQRQLASYARIWPHRSIWQMDARQSRAVIALPGHAAYVSALKDAGLRAFADEAEDDGLPSSSAPLPGSDVAPTPVAIPGGRRMTAAELHELFAQPVAPAVLDVGEGSLLPHGAVLAWPPGIDSGTARLLDKAIGDTVAAAGSARQIVVMGDGPYDTTAYNVALRLIEARPGRVSWFRGGEEAWAAAGYAGTDTRTQ